MSKIGKKGTGAYVFLLKKICGQIKGYPGGNSTLQYYFFINFS